MTVRDALDDFGALLKTSKATEIAYIGAADSAERDAAYAAWRRADEAARRAGTRLLQTPARSPADLVLKAKALRWHAPDRIEIVEPVALGGADPPQDSSFTILALHFLVRDLLALAE